MKEWGINDDDNIDDNKNNKKHIQNDLTTNTVSQIYDHNIS
jgi:hypothetical protein